MYDDGDAEKLSAPVISLIFFVAIDVQRVLFAHKSQYTYTAQFVLFFFLLKGQRYIIGTFKAPYLLKENFILVAGYIGEKGKES